MNSNNFKDRFIPYNKKLYVIACRLLGNSNDAEDMVQETYLRLWNKRDVLNNVDNDEAYIVTILRNCCFDLLKKQPEKLNQVSETDLIIEGDYSSVNQIESRDELIHVIKIMEHLPPQQKTVMHLRHIEDLSIEEIETETGLSNINIRTLLSRARKSIRQKFELIYT